MITRRSFLFSRNGSGCNVGRTPDEVTVFEALLTLLGFPALVFTSFKVDQLEVAVARRKKHLVETQKALKPDGWVGFGTGEDGKKMIPLRVLDEQGGKLQRNVEHTTSKLLGIFR